MNCFLLFLVYFFDEMVIPVVNRFRPKPEELVYYLKQKRRDPAFTIPDIKDVNIYKYHPSELPGLFSSYHPSELPGLASIQSDDQVWYFFCTLENKYGSSDRASRTAIGGSWKKTGKDHQVEATGRNTPIGIKKIFVFYQGHDFRKENRTNWVMHEYSDHNSNKQVESQQPRNVHLPSSSDYDVADSNLTEVEPHLQPNQNINCVTKNISPEVRPPVPALQDELSDQSLNHSSFPSLQSPFHSQPGSSHSSCFSNGSNVLTPQSASEQEDDLANSRHMESESQLPPKQHISANGEDLVTKNISSENKSHEPLPEQEDIFSGLEPPVSGKWDAIEGLQLPISGVCGDDSIVRNTLLVSELEDAFQILEGVCLDDILSET
ncbi:hypothetical protein Ddye_002455 [Dipteronia dyeriana]|uniref:NAC domain-containing protein n=1 Tax=Dipteronia dyeriana TaxID=168575 RepID=A0AAE0CUG6_9ROSI|nr:hypothetical protein Ddye_002455 [Dipteronia dyeriana]